MARTSELAAAYAATAYRVMFPDGPCVLRIGVPSGRLQGHLALAGAAGFVILTAHNPASRLLDAATNHRRQACLCAELRAGGFPLYPGENLADGDWPVEESCCVIGMPLAAAAGIALKYGQNAIVAGGGDAIPHLHWIGNNQP